MSLESEKNIPLINQGAEEIAREAEYAAMNADHAQFLESHGMVSISERIAPLVKQLSLDAQERWKRNEEVLNPLEKELSTAPEVERLGGLYQLGGKTIPNKPSPSPFLKRPAFHNRFNHSELLAGLQKVAGAHLGLSIEDLKISVAAGWLHDIGHSAFSHIGDDLLTQHGWPDHETRSVERMRKSPELQGTFKDNAMSDKDVADLIQEKGALGTLQSATDTLSYLLMDTAMAHQKLFPDNGFKYIQDILGIDPERNMLIVKSPEIWQELLEIRAKMMSEVYYHPVNKRTEEAARQLLRIAVDKKLISLAEIANGTDQELRHKLQSYIQYDPGAAEFSNRTDANPLLKEYAHLYSLLLGFENENLDKRTFDSEQEAILFLNTQSPATITSSLIIKPFDYTKKRLTVLVNSGNGLEEKTLRAQQTSLRPEDTKFVVLIKK